ncbi:hypothetical protein GJ744_010278 [Endocarpon pusillum]|uniref:Uncharacterized protein n=1 Tax=Endocarpon pusillum TaxID=364733 RepID=A0A8H7AET2_9EURO|nr:hypothetical protein GJ744_010278 [Endocarpon pusillum]
MTLASLELSGILLLRKRMTTKSERDSVDNQGKLPLDTEVFGDVDAQDLKAWNYGTEGGIVDLTGQSDRRPSPPTLDKAKPPGNCPRTGNIREQQEAMLVSRECTQKVSCSVEHKTVFALENHLLRWPDRCIRRKFRHPESLRSGLITNMTAPFTQKPGASEVLLPKQQCPTTQRLRRSISIHFQAEHKEGISHCSTPGTKLESQSRKADRRATQDDNGMAGPKRLLKPSV